MLTWYRNGKISEKLLKYLMKDFLKIMYGAVLTAGLWFIMPQAAGAGNVAGNVDIHGYGNQDFMDAGKNQYLGAKGGSWTENTMSIIFDAAVTDDTTIWARIHHHPEADATIDWLYVDKKVGSAVDLRAGQMKFPLGIYNMYAENKFLEVSELEPMMYSPDVDHLIFDIFNGVDAEYNNGTIGIEVFGGSHKMEQMDPMAPEVVARDIRGIRIPYRTPIDGLTLIVSGASFNEETATVPVTRVPQMVMIGSIDYVNYGFDLKAEYAEKKLRYEDRTVRSYYLQAGYTFFDKLIPYARYDVLYSDTHRTSDPSLFQKDATIGLGYKINEYLKVKAEEHFISGYDVPVESGEVVAGTGQDHWKLFVAGVDFVF